MCVVGSHYMYLSHHVVLHTSDIVRQFRLECDPK